MNEMQLKVGEKAVEYGERFHCSESVIRAINDLFELNMPDHIIKLATGFRGGGGGYGDRCGTLEAGILVLSYLYGRVSSDEECNSLSYLVRTLHNRFMEELGSIYCRILLPFHEKISDTDDCLYVYRKGAELVAGVLIEAEELIKNIPESEKNECSPKKVSVYYDKKRKNC